VQAPPTGEINLDHIAHFVPDPEACRQALTGLGFSPTPFSLQQHRMAPGMQLTPAGTGNHCVMLREGYLEFLAPMAATPVAEQLRTAMRRYVGVHSIVFGTAQAGAEFERLRALDFDPLDPIALQRPIDTRRGDGLARFSVVRVPPGTMAEGRMQFCQHHTQDLVWQPRWLKHPNRAVALRGVSVCVANMSEAVRRYERFMGRSAVASNEGTWRIETHRGWVELAERAALEDRLQAVVPAVPWIAGCTLLSADLRATVRCLEAGDHAVRNLRPAEISVQGPGAIGGLFTFAQA
jgi:hypothetical protein